MPVPGNINISDKGGLPPLKEERKMRISWVIKFLFRAFLGIGIILMVNKLIAYRNYIISVQANIFSFLTSGLLGLPGVCALYGIAFYSFL